MTTSRNIRLLVAYDGTEYAGWQVQPTQPTVQGKVEEAIFTVSGERVRLLSAGRTDSGVHALGQVANFFSSAPVPPQKWRAALQSKLPADIVILESDEVPPEFHATFSAISKRYRYIIRNTLTDDPFLRRFCWRITQSLDPDAMHAAAQVLLGRHDFRSFESDWPNKATSVRTVLDVTVRRASGWELMEVQGPGTMVQGATPAFDPPSTIHLPPYIVLEIEADGFLYNMVRAITGTLVNVGRGTWTAADVERVLHAQNRDVAGATAPASGLFMVRVNYPEDLSVRQPKPGSPQLDE